MCEDYHKISRSRYKKKGCRDGRTNHWPLENSFDEELIYSLIYIRNHHGGQTLGFTRLLFDFECLQLHPYYSSHHHLSCQAMFILAAISLQTAIASILFDLSNLVW